MKSHAVLINPPFKLKDGTLVSNLNQKDFPLGIGLLATILSNNGYSAEIINANIHIDWEDRVITALRREDVAFAGFSCMSSQIFSAINLSKTIKDINPDLPVIFGGVHPTLMPESLVRTPWVDICVVGEGDTVVVPLMDYINGTIEIERVPNICTTGNNGDIVRTAYSQLTSFDKLPDRIDERYYKDDLEKYILDVTVDGRHYRGFSLLTGLGCNYRCAFCINHITKRKYRSRPALSIYEEIKYLKNTYNITFFNFQEEHFFGDRPRLFELLDLLENDIDLYGSIMWNTTIRVSDIRDGFVNVDILRRLKSSGADGFGVGGESGSDRILKTLRKGISRNDIVRAVAYCNEAKIKLGFSFVMLWPGETIDDMTETARLILEIYEMGPYATVPFFQTYRPYPGSIWETDLSSFEDPEEIPDDTWRFQSVEDVRTKNIDNAEKIYRLVSSTQFLCVAGVGIYTKANIWSFKRHIADLLYLICRWRIRNMYFGCYIEGAALSYIRKRIIQY